MVLFQEVTTAWMVQFMVFSVRSGAGFSCDEVEEYAFHQIDNACGDLVHTSDCPFLESSDAVCDLITVAVENANNTALSAEDVAELSSGIDLLNATEFDFDLLFDAVVNTTAEAIESLYPAQRYMVTLPFVIAMLVATLTAFGTAILFHNHQIANGVNSNSNKR